MYLCQTCNIDKPKQDMISSGCRGIIALSRCKSCSKEADKLRKKEWYLKNKLDLRAKAKINYQNNKKEILDKNKESYLRTREFRLLRNNENYKANRDDILESQKKYQKLHKDRKRLYDIEYRKKNHIQLSEKKRIYRLLNIEQVKFSIKKWNIENPHKATALKALRRARKRQATPKWLTSKQIFEILQFYKLSKMLSESTGVPHEVDHIIPLKGNTVSGLHVPWNLQVITALENASKHNKLLMEYTCQQL